MMPRSMILSMVSRVALPTVLVFSVYLLASGHNQPGGGFVGGLVAGAAIVLAYASGGTASVQRVLPINADIVLGLGLATTQLTAFGPLLFGGHVLESSTFDLHLWLVGDVHMSTTLLFDIGVYLIVVGLVAKILQTLGAEEPHPRGTQREGRT